MINFQKSRIADSVARAVASPTLITAEGAPLVADSSVEGGVALTTGGANEVFVGVSYSQQKSLLALSTVSEAVVDANGNFTLPYAALSYAGIRFTIDGVALDTTPTTPGSPTATEVEQEGGSLQVFQTAAANSGKTVVAAYRFSPTMVQAQMLQGDVHPGGDSSYLLNSVGVVTRGDVYTTEFDSTADWTAAGALRLGAGGLFTNTGSGALIANARVIARPSAASPFLGVSIGNNG